MRIGHFVSFGIGGADQSAFRLIEAQKRAGLDPVVLGSDASRPSQERVTTDQDPHGKVLSIEGNYARIGVDVKIVRSNDEIKKLGLDILHTHRSGEDGFLLENLGSPGSARVVVETNFHGYLKTPADVRVFPSHALMEFRRLKPNPRFYVIPNPIMPRLSNHTLRQEWGLQDQLILGRLSRSDRSAYSPRLLAAYKFLKLRGHKVSLVWAGASSMAQRDARRLGLDDITWVPTSSDATVVSSWHNTFDIFCHAPRLGETFGNTVAEAMMHERPIVSWSGPWFYPQAQREVIDDAGQTANGAIGFLARLERFMTHPELRASTGQRNGIRAVLNYSPAQVASRYLKVYADALTEA